MKLSPAVLHRGTLQRIWAAPVFVLPLPSLETSNGTLFPVRLNDDSSTWPQCPPPCLFIGISPVKFAMLSYAHSSSHLLPRPTIALVHFSQVKPTES